MPTSRRAPDPEPTDGAEPETIGGVEVHTEQMRQAQQAAVDAASETPPAEGAAKRTSTASTSSSS